MIRVSRANRTVPLAFGSAALALLIVGAISYRGLQDSAESAKWVRHSHEVIETIQDFRFAIDTTDSSARSFVLTGEQKYLDSFNANKANAATAQSSLHILTADNLEQQRHLPLLQTLTAEKLQASEALIEQRRSNGSGVVPEALSSDSGQQTMTKLMSVVRLLQNEESRLLGLREAEATQRFEQAQTVLTFGTIFGLLIAMVAGWSVYRDMSARNRVEIALRESEERYSMLLDGVEDYAIYLIDAQGRVASWNSGAERIKGYRSDEIVGRHYSCFFPPEDIARGRPEQILRIAEENGRYEEQSTRVRKDGSQFLASLSFTALRDKDGNLRGFSEISHNLSKTNESEARYRGLLEAAPDAMVVVDQEGEIVLLNVQAEERFGYRRDELLGQKVTNIIPVGFAERLIADGTRSATEALAQQIGTGIELTALRKNGSEFPIEIMLSPLVSADGTLVTAAIRDISVRKAADEHLVQMEGRYRGLLEAAPDAMVVVDQQGEIVLLNVQAEKQFGYRRDELLGQKVTNIIPEGFAERLVSDALRSTEEALAQQIGTGIELSALRKDGSEFPIEIMLSPLQSTEGILVTAAIRDITARKQAEITLLHSVDELRRSNEELGQFAYIASHDLQEPLRMVASYTQLLSKRYKGKLDADADEFIAYAVDGAGRMQRLIQDLLAYSRVESKGKLLSDTSSEDALNHAMMNLRGAVEESGALVTHDQLPVVMADDSQLTQLFQNLVGNAIKYQNAGVPKVHVSAAKNGGEKWIFSVRDNGLGIDPKYFERIFGMFQRLHKRDEFAGTGIGLAICKKIVERHGGKISVESEPGHGSTFRFELTGK